MAKTSYVALIVDRNTSSRKSLTSILRQALQVNEVMQANSAQEALTILKTAKRVDWIFCDTGLPDQDCFSFLNEVKRLPLCKETPLILLSSQTNKELLIKAAGCGVSDFIKKPFTSSTLLEKLKRLIAGAEQRTNARHSLLGAYSATLQHDELILEGKLLDLSLGGCRLVCKVPQKGAFTVYQHLKLNFDIGEKKLTLNAETVRIERHPGTEDKHMMVAFEFVDMDQAQRDRLSMYIAQIQTPKKLKKTA